MLGFVSGTLGMLALLAWERRSLDGKDTALSARSAVKSFVFMALAGSFFYLMTTGAASAIS